MIEVSLSRDGEAPELVRSFAACLASVLEVDLDEVPAPPVDLRGAVAHWRSWLAGQGFGLVPIAEPRKFNWPGYWLAVLEDTTVVLMFGTPSGVVLSPQQPDLLGRASAELHLTHGFVVAGLDPASSPGTAPLPTHRGTVLSLAIAPEATAPMELLQEALAVAGRGLEGDRYAAKAGTFTPVDEAFRGHDLTLVDADVLDDLVLPDGSTLDHADARRNVVTRGIDLNALVGRRFRVGEAECLGQRLCEPCSHLERLTTKGVLRGLIHRGGLRADVLVGGRIEVGSVVETID